jgi:tetratricopeptide (TPR) repeat protein
MNAPWVKIGAPFLVLVGLGVGLTTLATPEPPSVPEMTELGIGYYKLGKYPEARSTLKEAMARSSGNFRALYGLGLVELDEGDLMKAEAYLLEALKAKPGDTEAYLTLGAVYQKGKAYKEADKIFRNILAKDPKNAKATYNLGMLMISMKRYPEAREYLQNYLVLAPRAKDKFRVLQKLVALDKRIKDKSKK